MRPRDWWGLLLCSLFVCGSAQLGLAKGGLLKLKVVDRDSGELLPFRLHLKNQFGRPVKLVKVPTWHDHAIIPGEIELKLPKGNYTFELECGPEYLFRNGYFLIQDNALDEKVVDMKRFIDMSQEGWWSGDLYVQRDPKDLELILRAEDLHVAPLVTWSQKQNAWIGKPLPAPSLKVIGGKYYYDLLSGKDERGGGTLLYHRLAKPLDLTSAQKEYPSAMTFLETAQQDPQAWVDLENLSSWDAPVWLASGHVNSVSLAPSCLLRDAMKDVETGSGRPRDTKTYKGPLSRGFWNQDLYYKILECGLRLPPSAGSGSGSALNPVGYNRVYVQVPGEFTYEKWWNGLQAGRCFVTNGPLIQVTVDREYPGATFTGTAGTVLEYEANVNLATRDRIRYLEVIQNGRVAHTVKLDEWKGRNGKMPKIAFRESGWFLIRVISDNDQTFRFASTAPYYVKIDGRRRVSKSAAEFFRDWVKERMAQIQLPDAEQRQQVLHYQEQALRYWEELVQNATTE